MMCPGVDLCFILIRVCWPFGRSKLVFLIRFQNLGHYFFKYSFCLPILCTLLESHYAYACGTLMLSDSCMWLYFSFSVLPHIVYQLTYLHLAIFSYKFKFKSAVEPLCRIFHFSCNSQLPNFSSFKNKLYIFLIFFTFKGIVLILSFNSLVKHIFK
jgi:hypothetical protein